MAEQRDFPYIWATWLPKLLTGENSCEWAVWFKAHYQGWDRPPSDFNQSEWMVRHTALLNQQKEEWQNHGYTATVENQNVFRLRGRMALLVGKPDLIVERGDDVLVIDVKTGREQAWHAVQVQIYKYAIARARPEYHDRMIAGQVVYPRHVTRAPRGALDNGFIRDLGALIQKVAAPNPPPAAPSAQECRFCDITELDCPERLEGEYEPAETAIDDF